jgi:hypothetical protein
MTAFPIMARERPLSGRKRKGWSWPITPIDALRLNGRYRDIAASGAAT